MDINIESECSSSYSRPENKIRLEDKVGDVSFLNQKFHIGEALTFALDFNQIKQAFPK